VLGSIRPDTLHIILAVVFLASLLWLLASPVWRGSAKIPITKSRRD